MAFLGTALTPIVEDHEFGINIICIDVQIVVDTETQMVTEEFNHVPVASQPLKTWITWIWTYLLCCFHPSVEEENKKLV